MAQVRLSHMKFLGGLRKLGILNDVKGVLEIGCILMRLFLSLRQKLDLIVSASKFVQSVTWRCLSTRSINQPACSANPIEPTHFLFAMHVWELCAPLSTDNIYLASHALLKRCRFCDAKLLWII